MRASVVAACPRAQPVAHGLSYAVAWGILPDEGSNLCPCTGSRFLTTEPLGKSTSNLKELETYKIPISRSCKSNPITSKVCPGLSQPFFLQCKNHSQWKSFGQCRWIVLQLFTENLQHTEDIIIYIACTLYISYSSHPTSHCR